MIGSIQGQRPTFLRIFDRVLHARFELSAPQFWFRSVSAEHVYLHVIRRSPACSIEVGRRWSNSFHSITVLFLVERNANIILKADAELSSVTFWCSCILVRFWRVDCTHQAGYLVPTTKSKVYHTCRPLDAALKIRGRLFPIDSRSFEYLDQEIATSFR